MPEKYKSRKITAEESIEIRKNPGWDWFCENNYGTCYWNNITGEIIWEGDDESNIQELIK